MAAVLKFFEVPFKDYREKDGKFREEWNRLSAEEQEQIKSGIASGSFTY